MKKRKIPVLSILGGSLVLISLCALGVLQLRMYAGARHCRQTVARLEEILPERSAGASQPYSMSGMPVLELEGVDYAAILEVPAFGITLPVANQWEGSSLSRGPARFWGSAYDGALVIGGMDTPGQFGFCDQIEIGQKITVTDMTGAQFAYTVCAVDRASRAETQWLTEEDYDLTLFCRNLYSTEYIAVRCVSQYEPIGG